MWNNPTIDYQNIVYYSAPKQKSAKKGSLDEVDPALLETFDKLGNSSIRAKKD